MRVLNVVDLAISLGRSQPSQRFFPARNNVRIVHVSCARFTFTVLIPVPDTAIRYRKHMDRLARATWPAFAALQFPARLHLGHNRKHVIQSLVLDNGRAMNRTKLVERCVGQGVRAMHNLQTTIGIIADNHLLSGQPLCKLRRLQDEQWSCPLKTGHFQD